MPTDPYTADAEWYGALTAAWQEPTDITLRSVPAGEPNAGDQRPGPASTG